MRKFTNLANIESSLRDIFHRVELEKAHIPAYRVFDSTGGGTTIVGLVELAYGTDVLLVRNQHNQWVGRMTGATFRGIDNNIVTWTDADTYSIRSELTDYVSDTQEALKEFQSRLRGEFGSLRASSNSYHGRTRAEPCELLSLFGFDPEQMHLIDAPADRSELARLEIMGLRAYGRALQSPFDIATYDEEALAVADTHLGKKSDDSFKILTWLAKYVKEQLDMCQQLLDQTPPAHIDHLKLRGRREWWLTKKLPLVTRLEWQKDLSSTARNLEVLRVELMTTYGNIAESFAHNADAIVAQYFEGDLKTTELARPLHLAAYNFALLHGICVRIGVFKAADNYNQLYTKYRALMTDAGRNELAKALVNYIR